MTAVAGDAQATISFSAPSDNGGSAITSYTATAIPGSITHSGTTSPITVTGLTNNTEYTFTVHATNAVGDSIESEVSNAVTPKEIVVEVCSEPKPDTPSIDSIEQTQDDSVRVFFSIENDDDADTFTLEYGTASGIYGEKIRDIDRSDRAKSVKDLLAGESYFFRLRAENNCKKGDWSDEQSITLFTKTVSEEVSSEEDSPKNTGTPSQSVSIQDSASENVTDSTIDQQTSSQRTEEDAKRESKKENEQKGVIYPIQKWIKEELPFIQVLESDQNKTISNAMVASGAVASLAGISLQTGSFYSVWMLVREVLLRIAGTFLWRKRKTEWGTVYDTESGKPLPLTQVQIVDPNSGKMLDSRITDAYGSYSFLVSPGTYILKPQKEGFVPVKASDSARTWYENSDAYSPLTYARYDQIHSNLPMRQEQSRSVSIASKSKGKRFMFGGIFWAGFLLNTGIFLADPQWFNGIMLGVYVFLQTVHLFGKLKIQWGVVKDSLGHPQSFAVVKLLDAETKTRVARTIADEKGRYAIITNPGQYILSVETIGGKGETLNISLKKRGLVKANVEMGK